MKIDPLNVLYFLLVTVENTESPMNYNEIKLRGHFEDILFNEMNDFNGMELRPKF